MAIDYFGSFPCPVRETLSDADLLRMEKARNRAQAVLEIMRKDPRVDKRKPESEWTFKTVILGPNGPEETEMRVADCLAEAAELPALARHCAGCPKNVRGADFGCGGAIHYPITARAESWLVSRLPADLDSRRGQLLVRAIADFEFDGACIDAVRGRKDLYQADAPAERKWGGFFSRKTRITSSQILHMAFAVGSLQPAHAKLVAYFLGYLNDDFSASSERDLAPLPGDDGCVVELKNFLRTAALAGPNGVPVLVDA